MTFEKKISTLRTIFIDTAPIIYFIEGHATFGKLVKILVDAFQSGSTMAYSSVITITEVLPKPISEGKEELANRFMTFFRHGKNFEIVDITDKIAERAGRLRGKYNSLRTLDALQLSSAIELQTDAFVTNDTKLQIVNEIEIIILKDYILTNQA